MTDTAARLTAALSDRYRIERELGTGGMATVYLAEDLKHKRRVAVKVLKPELAAVLGAERFVQEITTTAALQHPHILPLFDSGSVYGPDKSGPYLFYVMPFIDGETLRAKLDRETQLGIDEAVKITTAVADALDYAHRHGVIHRDIKPENILLHEGRPMVADFGIALAVSAAAGGRMTETGLSLGTPHYMSPEQATAEKEITARSDIYSLASVLYEMLTGEPPHMGKSAQQIIMKIIAEPVKPVTDLRKSVPSHVAAAVGKGLEKLPADRFESAAKFAEALNNPAFTVAGIAGGTNSTSANMPSRLTIIGLTAVATIAVALAAWGWLRSEPPRPVVRHEVVLGRSFTGALSFAGSVAIAPDESSIVYSDSLGARRQLYLKPAGEVTAVPLAGTDGAYVPFFSPDGAWVGFLAESKLKKVSVGGAGGAVTLADSWTPSPNVLAEGTLLGGGAWTDDDRIYFINPVGGLSRVSAGGGAVEVVWEAAQGGGGGRVVAGISPLPGDRGVVFVVCEVLCNSSDGYVFDARRGESREILPGARGAVYAPTGHIVFGGEAGGLFAASLDLRTLTIGGAIPVVDGVRAYDFIVSANGTLAYILGGVGAGQVRGQPVWITRGGTRTPVDAGFELSVPNAPGLSLAPDGSRLALGVQSRTERSIWIKDLGRPNGSFSRLSFDGDNVIPRWTPDSRSVLFTAGAGVAALYIQGADGVGGSRVLASADKAISEGVYSPDGEWLLLRVGRGGDRVRDILALRVDRDSVPGPLVAEPFDEISPAVSPDGRWLAYVSNESGRFEIYVRPFPDVSTGRWQVSSGGGVDPRWSPRAGELFYLSPASLVAAQYQTTPAFRVVGEQALFPVGPDLLRGTNYALYDVAPDGNRFIFLQQLGRGEAGDVRVILAQNWLTELKERMRR